LFDIALDPYRYDDFELTDYIDNEYFYVESLDDITTDMGTIALVEENGQQKVVWNVNGEKFYSGAEASLKIKVKLKDQYHDLGGYYPTNTGADVESSILGEEKNTTTTNTPVLRHGYEVLYDMNTPEGCSLENIEDGTYYAYEKVEINSAKPQCSGYEFRGWKPTSKIEYVNNDYYLMPARNLTFKATWAKMDISKDMEGNIYEVITLYETIKRQAVLDNIPSTYVTDTEGIRFTSASGDTNGKGIYTIASTENDEYPIHYYRGEVDNNVVFAGYCWKIIRTTETGGIKLIYNGTPSSTGTCNTPGANASAFKSKFNPVNYSRAVGYSGYMNNDLTGTAKDFVYRSRTSSSLFGNSVTYDTSTQKYTLVDTKTLGELIDTETDLASHHYYCKDASATCTEVYYVVSIYGNRTADNPDDDAVYSIKLTNGKTIEDLLEASIIGEHTDINKNSSTLKTSLDNWYTNNFVNYTPYLENTIYCNDRTINDWAGFNPNGTKSLQDSTLFYDVFYRAAQGKPTHECRQVDSFTLSTANGGTEGYGNNKLKYPVGIITTDEVVYAGATQNHANRNHFLYLDGASYATYTMSAYSHNSDGSSSGWQIYATYDYTAQGGPDYSGSINGGYMHTSLGIRPVISLKNNMSYGKGDGTANNPYVILAN
jgi:hypothetical protein